MLDLFCRIATDIQTPAIAYTALCTCVACASCGKNN